MLCDRFDDDDDDDADGLEEKRKRCVHAEKQVYRGGRMGQTGPAGQKDATRW